jgi:RNA polymerase sigma-70 factor (ECF subfamily)
VDQDQITKQFYALVWPHRTDVLRVAQFLCRDGSVAEDLAQETLLKAFRALSGVQTATRDLKPWLLVILRNIWKDRIRASHAEMSLEALKEEPEAGPAASNDVAEFWKDPQMLMDAFSDQQIIEAMKTLPEEIRWTLLLVDIEGIGMHEAAEILQVPSGTIKSRAHRGRAMLRESLLPLARELRLVTEEVKSPKETDLRAEEL